MAKVRQLSAEQKKENIARINKSGFMKKKVSLAVYAIVLVLAVAARTLQLYSNVDFALDRYIDPSPLKNYPMMVIIPGFILIAFILLAGSAKDKVVDSCILINPMRLRYDRLRKKIPHSAGYSALLMALLVIVQIVLYFVTLVQENEEIMKTLTKDERDDYSRFTGYTLGQFGIHFVMLLVALNFISIAVNIFKGEGISSGNCAAFCFYGMWKVIELLNIISDTVAVSESSEKLYIMFSYMTAVIFFLNTARFFNGMEKKSTRFWMCFTGYLSSVLAAVSVIPRYILLLVPTGYENRLDMKLPDVSDIGIVFMTITLVAVFWTTYVYRVMPKLNLGKRRWSKAPISKEYLDIETLELQPVTEENLERKI